MSGFYFEGAQMYLFPEDESDSSIIKSEVCEVKFEVASINH